MDLRYIEISGGRTYAKYVHYVFKQFFMKAKRKKETVPYFRIEKCVLIPLVYFYDVFLQDSLFPNREIASLINWVD